MTEQGTPGVGTTANGSVSAWIKGNIITMDPERPRARALVERDGSIEFVGDDARAIEIAGPTAIVRDLAGATVIPSFNDNHLHALFYGERELAPKLAGLCEKGVIAFLKERFPNPKRNEIIVGYDWDYTDCLNPRKESLDNVFPENPVLLFQFSGHALWLNSRALDKCGIRKGSRDPGRSLVLRDPDGEPTGVVRELPASRLFLRYFIRLFLDSGQRMARLTRALAIFASLGITSIQDNTWYALNLWDFARLRRRGELTARVSAWTNGESRVSALTMRLCRYDGNWIKAGPRKFFIDGTFSTRTASLCEEYADDPGCVGMVCEEQRSFAILSSLAKHGRQGAFHIIGDRGIEIFLNAAERVAALYPQFASLRTRIEHAQLIRSEDLPRLKRLGVIIAAQPSALATPEKDKKLLGEGRALKAYPYRSLIDSGVELSFGSDIPGESICDPIACIHMAVNREGPERIEADEALRCYTSGSAHAEFAEGEKGALREGMLADFVVLSDDILSVPRERIKDIRVTTTVVGGRIVYEARYSPARAI